MVYRDASNETSRLLDGEPSDCSHITEDVCRDDELEGVRRAEAVKLVWTKSSLILAYIFIWLVYFVNALEQSMGSQLNPYVVSDFSSHELIATISAVSSILGGVLRIPTAKVLDLWGRSEGFTVMTAVFTLGLVLMASCTSVQSYAAAQVVYGIGATGMTYVLSIVIADTSSLRNRALAFAFANSPYIATAFAGPALAKAFHTYSNFRWAFATFAIITPVMALPIIVLLTFNQRKAKTLGVLVEKSSGRSTWEDIKYYFMQFDAVGVLLFSAGLVLFLIPFSVAGSEANAWKSSSNISTITFGMFLLLAFGIWEKYGTRRPYIPFNLLSDRTVFGACLLPATLFVSYYCWDGYYSSYLQVVHNLTITEAGYVSNIFNVVGCFWGIVVGVLIRITGRFKWLAWCALVFEFAGGSLMIYFRQPDTYIGFVLMCQVFIAIGGGTLVICEEMAMMTVAKHGQVAALLAILSLAASVGGGIGSSISGAIWQNTFPRKLLEFLPDYAKGNATAIYENLDLQLSYEMGDPVREAIIKTYGVTQQRMCIAGTLTLSIGFMAVAMLRNVSVRNISQEDGTVF